MLGHMYLSMNEWPKFYWLVLFGHKRLRYKRDTAGIFLFKLLYYIVYMRVNLCWTVHVWIASTDNQPPCVESSQIHSKHQIL